MRLWSPLCCLPLLGVRSVPRPWGGACPDTVVVDTRDGTVWTWGGDDWGQLGTGSGPSLNPVSVPGLTDVRAVAVGSHHTLALRSDGTVWAWGRPSRPTWGRNRSRQGDAGAGPWLERDRHHRRGENHPGATRPTGASIHGQQLQRPARRRRNDGPSQPGPRLRPGPRGGSCGGWQPNPRAPQRWTAKAFGLNGNGQLGDGTTIQRVNPSSVASVSNATALTGGATFTLVRRNDATVSAWGGNDYGQLGDGTTAQRLTAVDVGGLSGVGTVVTAPADLAAHSFALTSDGSVWAGQNSLGQLGDGTR